MTAFNRTGCQSSLFLSVANTSWSGLWQGSFSELRTNISDLSDRLDALSNAQEAPSGYEAISGDDEHFYLFSDVAKSFSEAQTLCVASGAHLPIFESLQQYQKVRTM